MVGGDLGRGDFGIVRPLPPQVGSDSGGHSSRSRYSHLMEPVRSHPVAQNEAAKLEPATGDGKVKLVREEVDRLHKMGPVDSHRVAPESMEGLIQREKSQV